MTKGVVSTDAELIELLPSMQSPPGPVWGPTAFLPTSHPMVQVPLQRDLHQVNFHHHHRPQSLLQPGIMGRGPPDRRFAP